VHGPGADERGSILAASNSSGTVTNVNTYDEYGKPGSANVGWFQYTGQKWIAELGLYDYKARMYHPFLPRFMQTDPLGWAAGPNDYDYVGGDPINLVDSTGLCTATLWGRFRHNEDWTGVKLLDTWVDVVGCGDNSSGGGVPAEGGGFGSEDTCAEDAATCSSVAIPSSSNGTKVQSYQPLNSRDRRLVAILLSRPGMIRRLNSAWQRTLATGREHGFLVWMKQLVGRISFSYGPVKMGNATNMGRDFAIQARGYGISGNLFWLMAHTHIPTWYNNNGLSNADLRFNRDYSSIGILITSQGVKVGR